MIAKNNPLDPYVPEREMDIDFPRNKIHISRNRYYRKKTFCDSIFNINRYKHCTIEAFHTKINVKCKCIYCGHAFARGHMCPEK